MQSEAGAAGAACRPLTTRISDKETRSMARPEYTAEELANEEWRPLVGLEEWYSVSNLGRLRRDKAAQGARAGRIFCGYIDCVDGYLRTTLHRNGQPVRCKIHQLVARTFIGPPPTGHEINHIDENKANPRSGNLEYVSHRANMLHSRATLASAHSGALNHNAAFTRADVLALRARRSAGAAIRALANEYGVCYETMRRVLAEETYRPVAPTEEPEYRQE